MRSFRGSLVLAALATLPAALPVLAQSAPLPRYASLRFETVHVRAAPTEDAPIRWSYKRQGLPVMILREHENWRYIRDWEGGEGWVFRGGLSPRRHVQVVGAMRSLRDSPVENADPVAKLEPGVIGRLEKCDSTWCRISVKTHRGWIRHAEVFGVKPGERVE